LDQFEYRLHHRSLHFPCLSRHYPPILRHLLGHGYLKILRRFRLNLDNSRFHLHTLGLLLVLQKLHYLFMI